MIGADVARASSSQALMSLFSDFHLVDLLIRRELEAHGVNVMWLAPLDLIAAKGEITPTEIAAEMGLPPTTVRRAVSDLEKRGEVRRRPNPNDGRSQVISLTAKGRRKLEEVQPVLESTVAAIEEFLGWRVRDADQPFTELKEALQHALGFGTATPPEDRRRWVVEEVPPGSGLKKLRLT
jgi:DNA-binding MarR family transcriptional regulator